MAQRLGDNTVIPSYLGMTARGESRAASIHNSTALRVGEVKKLVWPTEDESTSKRFVEYQVEVQFKDGSGPGATVTYYGCLLANLFGGMADILRYTLRPDSQNQQNASEDGLGIGSKVLLLCINGEETKALILGGIRDSVLDDSTKDLKDDGHNLFFEFNGLQCSIDRDGQFKLVFQGATDEKGKRLDSAKDENQPTTVQILKNGNFEVSTKDEKQLIRLDHANKKTTMVFDEAWELTVNKKAKLDIGDTLTCTVGASISVKAKQDITIKSDSGGMLVQTANNIKLKSSGVLVGGATDSFMMGTTYRNAQQQLHSQLLAGFQALSGIMTAVAGALSGFPATAPAGAALTPATALMAQMATAIQTFEGQAATYLSKLNKND